MNNKIIYVTIISAAIILSGSAGFLLASNNQPASSNQHTPAPSIVPENYTTQTTPIGLKKFNSTEEMQQFLIDSHNYSTRCPRNFKL